MQSLDEKMWEPIPIGKQFNLRRGRESKSTVEEGGVLPFVSAKNTDNGYRMFVKTSKTKIDGNTLSLNNNGDGGAGFGYYQPHEYTVDVNATALIPHQDVPFDCYIGLFWTGCFTWMHEYFGNARTLSNKRAEMTKIMLPVNDSGKPDYEYMAEYTRQKRGEMLDKYRKYAEARIVELGKAVEIPALDEKEWKPIFISSIFELVRGRENNMAMLKDGDTPLISAKANNNGLKGFVHNPKKIITGQCITLNNDGDGGAGLAYYQPANMALDSHVTALVPLFDMSAFAMLFIAKCISGLHGFFGHGLSISNPRAKRLRIMLPVTDSGEPDYAYMEQYVKNMMLRKYQQYFSYSERNS